MKAEKRTIIFFDGICHLCNSWVDFLLRRDKRHVLLFAPLQGGTALNCELIKPENGLKSILLLENGEVFDKSTAVLRALVLVGGWTKVFSLFFFVPRSIRDSIYDFVAVRRYKYFGQRDTCRMPQENESAYFLP